MWNDNETNIDLFGHARIAKTISALIREERLSPLTMGVHGDWGAGKSSVLQLVEQELKDDDDVLCLRFNGWLFQGFDDTKGGYDSNGAKSNAKGCRLVSLAVSVRLRGGPRPSRSGTYRRG